MPKVVLIHTVRPAVDSIGQMLKERVKDIEIVNLLDEYILKDILDKGEFTRDNLKRLYTLVNLAEQVKPDAIMVTCSSLSVALDSVKPFINTPIYKIDEVMINKAVEMSSNIKVMATAKSTLQPTMQQLNQAAASLSRKVDIEGILCSEAFNAMMKGDKQTHDDLLKKEAAKIKGECVVVLAQASMAALEQDIHEICGQTVLSSPAFAVDYWTKVLSKH
jgi:uncharacterized protein YeeX (DUF496 family)